MIIRLSWQTNADLPRAQPHHVTLVLSHPGEFEFTCAMGKSRGQLLAKETAALHDGTPGVTPVNTV
jgi:hypothetical protein